MLTSALEKVPACLPRLTGRAASGPVSQIFVSKYRVITCTTKPTDCRNCGKCEKSFCPMLFFFLLFWTALLFLYLFAFVYSFISCMKYTKQCKPSYGNVLTSASYCFFPSQVFLSYRRKIYRLSSLSISKTLTCGKTSTSLSTLLITCTQTPGISRRVGTTFCRSSETVKRVESPTPAPTPMMSFSASSALQWVPWKRWWTSTSTSARRRVKHT